MGITSEDFERMKARVAGAVEKAAEPVRATLPQKFTIIGHPVSINEYYRSVIFGGKPAITKSKEARTWDGKMEDQLRTQWNLRLPIEEEVFLIVDFFIAANKMDVDNPLKPLQDALQSAGILKNDRLVRRATITKHVDRDRPRVEIHLYPSNLTPL